VITAESLRLASLSAATEVQRLALYAEQSAAALAAAEQRAEKAEQALKWARQRQAKLKTAPADLVAAARSHLDKIDSITTEQFCCGDERETREALRVVLEAIEANDG
jgi:hypothetical protein